MIDNWEEIEDAIIALTGKDPRVTTKGEHIHTCPFCDREGHFYVNYEKGVYNCYRCGGTDPDSHGSIRKLAGLLGVEVDDEAPMIGKEVMQLTGDQMLENYLQTAGFVPVIDVNVDETPIVPPPGWEIITGQNAMRHFHAVSYLYSRGINNTQIDFYRIGVALGGTKVVFPDFNAHGQLRWWQMRGLGETYGPKYQGPEGLKGGKIGNYYGAARQTWYVGVAEGPISAIIAGYEFCWLWGKEHSPEQVVQLARLNKPVVIALDGEEKAFRNAMGLARDLRDEGTRVYIVPMPGGHDPASLGGVAFRQLLSQTLSNQQGSDLDFLDRVVRDYV